MIAYGIAFTQDSRCNISKYHHDLIYTILTGISTTLLGMSLVRLNDFDDDDDEDGELLLTGVIRRILTAICLGGIIFYGLVPANKVTRVPKPEHDSIAVLPLFCFNDASLNPLANLSSTEKSHLCGEGMANSPIAQVLILARGGYFQILWSHNNPARSSSSKEICKKTELKAEAPAGV